MLWSEGERMRKRLGIGIPTHRYGIYSIDYKTCSSSIASQSSNIENKELLKKVNTMRLHEVNDTDNIDNRLKSFDTYENGNKPAPRLLMAEDKVDSGTVTPPTSASDNDVTETEEESTASTVTHQYHIARRRKSPILLAKKATTTNSLSVQRTDSSIPNQSGQRRISAGSTEQSTNTQIEKKVRKPPTAHEVTVQRPTIASTVKMTQTAIERRTGQTQGDKLNQIKAMRRQHNSRLSAGSGSG